MPLPTNTRRLLAAIAVWISGTTAIAQMMPQRGGYPGGVCAYGPDGSCAPHRETYGYYPTSWRRWPTEFPTAAAKPQPETISTPPANEPTPKKKQSEQSKPESEDTLEAPDQMTPEGESAPAMTPPSDNQPTQPRREPSGDEGPPSMPANPQESSPLDRFPAPPSTIQPPDIEDSPPTMPLDDPFKDDPPQPPSSSGPETPRSELQHTPADKSLSQGEAPHRWRVTAGEITSPRNVPAEEPVSNGEPALLPVTGTVAPHLPGQLETSGSQKQNPLRLTKSTPPSSQVVRAAQWTADVKPVSVPSVVQRRNPLRSN